MRHWPLCREFTGDRWIPRTNGQWCRKCFNLMTSLCLANFLLIYFTKPYSVNMVDHSKPGGIYHREDEKVRISICHERVDANLTLASTGISNELVQCKIYNKSAIFSSIFSLVHSTWKIFCMEIIGTPTPECAGIPLGYRQVKRPCVDFSVSISEQILYVVALCNVKFHPAQHSEECSDV